MIYIRSLRYAALKESGRVRQGTGDPEGEGTAYWWQAFDDDAAESKANEQGTLKALYQGCWHVELDLRNIKTTLGMEMLVSETRTKWR